MSKILNFINHVLNWMLNLIILAGVAVFLAWLIWGIAPQESIMKTGYFLSDGWHWMTCQTKTKEYVKPVTREQLEESSQKTLRYYEK